MSIAETLVYGRLEEVCPVKDTREMSFEELVNDCNVAFKIIGYSPKNLEATVTSVKDSKEIPILFEFIYEVWLNDA